MTKLDIVDAMLVKAAKHILEEKKMDDKNVTTTPKMTSVPVQMVWEQVVPDTRQYKPSAPVLKPVEVLITVHVPLQHEFIDNLEFLCTQEDKPILTPVGMKYVIDILEDAMNNSKVPSIEKPTQSKEKSVSWNDDNDDSWDDEDTSKEEVAEEKADLDSDEDW